MYLHVEKKYIVLETTENTEKGSGPEEKRLFFIVVCHQGELSYIPHLP